MLFLRGKLDPGPSRPGPHLGTQPEAGLRRLRVPSDEQNPGAGPPGFFFSGAPGDVGPRKVGLSSAWVSHGRPGSAGCPLAAATTRHAGPAGPAWMLLRWPLRPFSGSPASSKELTGPRPSCLPVALPPWMATLHMSHDQIKCHGSICAGVCAENRRGAPDSGPRISEV